MLKEITLNQNLKSNETKCAPNLGKCLNAETLAIARLCFMQNLNTQLNKLIKDCQTEQKLPENISPFPERKHLVDKRFRSKFC